MRREPARSEAEGNLLFADAGREQISRFVRNDKTGQLNLVLAHLLGENLHHTNG
jgi:hypothetical protein